MPDLDEGLGPELTGMTRTATRQELTSALTSIKHTALILDLDQPDAVETITQALEIRPHLAVLAVTGQPEVERVIAAQRAGCLQFAKRPIDADDLRDALRRAIQDAKKDDSAELASRVFGVMGAIGGAGASTVACHLSVELTEAAERPSLIVDLDLEFGVVARAMDLTPAFTIADLAKSGAIDGDALARSAAAARDGTRVLSRPRSVSDAHAIEHPVVRDIFRVARATYGVVTVDLPHRLDPITGAGIEASDRLLIVTQLTVPSLDNTQRLIEALCGEGYPADRLEIVVNRYRKNVHTCTVEMVEKQLGMPVAAVIPSDYAAAHQAFDLGESIAAKNPVRAEIAKYARRLLGLETARTSTGWLGKLGLGRRPAASPSQRAPS